MAPTATISLVPEVCSCGQRGLADFILDHTQPGLELPVRRPAGTHWLLHQGQCLAGGQLCTATVPAEQGSGYGRRLTGFVGERAGIVGASRRAVPDLGPSVCGISLSKGAIQQLGERVSEALGPHDTTRGAVARTSLVHAIDETSWLLHGDRPWRWGMANPAVAYCQMHSQRAKAAFAQLIGDWRGVRVSDGYLVSQYWQGLRPSCLAHLIRPAKGLPERMAISMARFGARVHAERQRLCPRGTERPPVGQWRAWSARFGALINRPAAREDKAGPLARRLARAGEALGVFLDVQGVEATTKTAERAHRFGVLWRKRRQGPGSAKGNRWVERGLSVRHTCRIRGRPTFPVLVEAVACLCKGERPDLRWLTQHESLPVPSTP